ncbi:hypothetical protein MRX96_022374 [Rhipicephalus microplus]
MCRKNLGKLLLCNGCLKNLSGKDSALHTALLQSATVATKEQQLVSADTTLQHSVHKKPFMASRLQVSLATPAKEALVMPEPLNKGEASPRNLGDSKSDVKSTTAAITHITPARNAVIDSSASARELGDEESLEGSVKSVKRLIKAKDRQLMIMRSSQGQSVGPDDSFKVVLNIDTPKSERFVFKHEIPPNTPKVDYFWEATPKPTPGPFVDSDDYDLTKGGSGKLSREASTTETVVARWSYSRKLSESASEADEQSKTSLNSLEMPKQLESNVAAPPEAKQQILFSNPKYLSLDEDKVKTVKAVKTENQPCSLVSQANSGMKTTPGSAVGWYNQDGTPQRQDHPDEQESGHAGNNAEFGEDGNAYGGMVTKEELERYMKIAKDLKLRRGSLMPSSGTLQSSESVAVGTKRKPSLVMETRIELYGKGRVTFSFDAVARRGHG